MRDELAAPDLHEQVVRLPDRLELRLRPGQIPELRQEPVLRDESPRGPACISARVDADGDDSDVAPLLWRQLPQRQVQVRREQRTDIRTMRVGEVDGRRLVQYPVLEEPWQTADDKSMLRLRLAMGLGLLSPLVRLARWSLEGEQRFGPAASRDALPIPGAPTRVANRSRLAD